MNEREPDHTEDPRGQDTGEQMPEEAPSDQADAGGQPEPGSRGGDRSGENADSDAPDITGDGDGNAPGASGEGSQSTGNPAAAG